MTARRFAFDLDLRFAPLWGPFALGLGRSGVFVDAECLEARFGLLRLRTPLSNVADAHRTDPYRWWTAVGPRLSFVDDGLTFGTTDRGGVCIHFHRPVGPVVGWRAHSALTTTVADQAGLMAALAEATARS